MGSFGSDRLIKAYLKEIFEFLELIGRTKNL